MNKTNRGKPSRFLDVLIMLAIALCILFISNGKKSTEQDFSIKDGFGSESTASHPDAGMTAEPPGNKKEPSPMMHEPSPAPAEETLSLQPTKAPVKADHLPQKSYEEVNQPPQMKAPEEPDSSAALPSEEAGTSSEQTQNTIKVTTQADKAAEKLPEPAAPDASMDIEALKAALQRFLSRQDGKYGLYFKNLVTGQSLGICERDQFIAASTTKLPMNLLLYRKAAAGEIDLQEKLTYLPEDFEAGTGVIQTSPYGTEYTVREAARLSIVCSDNCGINMIIRLLEIENIRNYMQELGGTVRYERGHRSCPYDLALYAEELYRFSQQAPEVAGYLMEDLTNTEWNDRINRLLPKEVKVPHKIGNYPGVYNDVGIVFASQPFVLAVMSDSTTQDAASDVIAQLSRMIYDAVGKSIN